MCPIKQECQVVGPGARIDTFMMQTPNNINYLRRREIEARARVSNMRQVYCTCRERERGNATIYPRLDEIMRRPCKQTAGRREFLICMLQIDAPGLIARPPQQRRACAADAAGRVIANFTRPGCECTTYACTCAALPQVHRRNLYTRGPCRFIAFAEPPLNHKMH